MLRRTSPNSGLSMLRKLPSTGGRKSWPIFSSGDMGRKVWSTHCSLPRTSGLAAHAAVANAIRAREKAIVVRNMGREYGRVAARPADEGGQASATAGKTGGVS